MTIRGCKVCGGIVADHLEIYAGTPCTCDRRAAPTVVPPSAAPERDYLGNVVGTELVHSSYVAETTAEIMRLRTRNRALEGAIEEHNKRCERECDSRLFGSLPRRYLIKVPK